MTIKQQILKNWGTKILRENGYSWRGKTLKEEKELDKERVKLNKELAKYGQIRT